MVEASPDSLMKQEYARLFSLAAHEFRTPASVVSGYLRMLQRDEDTPLGARQRKMIEEAEKSCARLVALIAELSEVGKLDAGTVVGHEERFDLFQALEQVADGMHEAADRDVRLKLSGATSGATMTGDLTRLKLAYGACLRAVLREQPRSCTVVAERRLVAQPVASAVVVVAEESALDGAWHAGEGPFDENRGGLGLALPIARRVVERHGGRISSPASSKPEVAITIVVPLLKS